MMKSEMRNEIRKRLEVITGRAEGNLAEAIRYLDENRFKTNGHLAHYLAKRSYLKALELMEGDNPEAGTCQ